MHKEERTAFVNRFKWRFAKTYAAFAPHEYLVLNWLRAPRDRKDFYEFSKDIFEHGTTCFYNGRYERKYLEVDGYWYWSMDATPEETDLINRCLVEDYIVDKDGNMYFNKKRRTEQKE